MTPGLPDTLTISNAAAEASCVAEALTQATAYWVAQSPELEDLSRQCAERHLAKCAALMGFELVRREITEQKEAA